jgi:hypothetical protein
MELLSRYYQLHTSSEQAYMGYKPAKFGEILNEYKGKKSSCNNNNINDYNAVPDLCNIKQPQESLGTKAKLLV